MDMRCCKGHVEQRQQTGRVPCRSRCQLVTLQQNDIIPTRLGQMISDRGSDGTAADDTSFYVSFHSPCSDLNSSGERLQIFDVFGRNLKTQNITSLNTTISLENFSEGVYFFKIESGISTTTKKIIITNKSKTRRK